MQFLKITAIYLKNIWYEITSYVKYKVQKIGVNDYSITKQLNEDGIAVIENFYSSNYCDLCIQDIDRAIIDN